MGSGEERSEIVFFDVETTVPYRVGQGFSILEFGAILVCPRKLVELESYSTLVRPLDISRISGLSVRSNGIKPDTVASAPTFRDIADRVFDILHGLSLFPHSFLLVSGKQKKIIIFFIKKNHFPMVFGTAKNKLFLGKRYWEIIWYLFRKEINLYFPGKIFPGNVFR